MRCGMPPKCSNARTWASRKETWSARSYIQAKSRPEYIRRITNSHAFLCWLSSSTTTSKKSTWATSPGRYVSGTNASSRRRFHSRKTWRTVVTPTSKPSARRALCRSVPVTRCLAVVRVDHSCSNASTRSRTSSRFGVTRAFRGRSAPSQPSLRYFRTVFREQFICLATLRTLWFSTRTLCLITCT